MIEGTFYITLFFSLTLIFFGFHRFFVEFSTFKIALLGFGIMIFLDIASFHFIDPKPIKKSSLIFALIYSYLSFLIFLIGYNFTKKAYRKVNNNPKSFSMYKFEKIIIPISFIFLIVFAVLQVLYPAETKNPFFLLISFLPKATTVLFFLFYLETRKKKYLIFFLIFMMFSLTETSRRIYITLFFILLPIFIGYFNYRNKILPRRTKNFLVIIGLSFFIFLNYLRANHDFGEGYKEDNLIGNTWHYIISLKSLDTFYNTTFIIENFPNRFNYYLGETYSSVLFMFVPRAIWLDKPVGFAAPLGVLQRNGEQDFTLAEWQEINMYSLSPGFIGEAYANLGIIGIITLSFVFGVQCKKFDLSFRPEMMYHNYKYVSYFAWCAAFFLLLRGDFFSAVYFSVFYFIFIRLIVKYCQN
ncbi:hypothetical protein LPB144_08420 [Christiangramia salexigens]|uniref:Oligosaccharide repeat unit polymerase n=2 Tax=Christiangramia salexigens TaxID=1913577 RepID=A0A1L3J5N0_9FLAO|nr:hypothetical protein LPB144_08420 [Christiangramia salexigens]